MPTSESARRVWRWFAMRENCAEDNTDLFAALAVESPVVHFPGLWVVSRHDLVTKLSNHPALTMVSPDFPAEIREGNPEFTAFFSRSMSVRAPEDHRRLRGVLAREFSARNIERLRERIDTIVDGLIVPRAHGAPFDFVAEVAVPLPSLVTAALLGLPEQDWPQVTRWARGLLAQLGKSFPGVVQTADPISVTGFQELRAYVSDIVDARHGGGEDVISRLNQAAASGQMSRDEVIDMVLLLFMTGVDTVTSGLTNTLACLLTRPDDWQRVVDDPRRWAGVAWAESLRLLTPVTFGARMAAEDTRVGPLHFRAGEVVLLSFAAANLDPRRFEDPLAFRWDRNQSASLAFGHGAYFCLGAGLGGLQAEATLSRLARTGVELATPVDRLDWRAELTFNSPAELPVRVGATAGETAVPQAAVAPGVVTGAAG
ncbi:cytochrome P450 [Streptomyces litmocidini]|uniref:cytochrome P450 n=1 Tax=Streptomyces litmocidini TaxID=67318 RepID=UPI0036F7052C